jgi:hypothetical protein
MRVRPSRVKSSLVALVVGGGLVGLWLAPPAHAAAGSAGIGPLATASVKTLPQQFDRADFMEDTPEEIAQENRANPFQAWALAFFPTLVVKGVTLTLAMLKAKDSEWAVYLPMIPSMGHSHFWETDVWWAGLIALGGDLVGSGLLTYYFAQYYESTATTRPDKTMLWAGISVLAIFFAYENISAPIIASWRNKKLRKQFMPAKDEDKSAGMDPRWRQSPWPARGLADIGPGLRRPAVAGAAYAFQF